MKAVLFSKLFNDRNARQLVELAHEVGAEGYDLCIRPGHPVTPDNVEQALPEVVGVLRDSGLDVPMATLGFDMVSPTDPSAGPTMAALARAEVPLVKLGCFPFRPGEHDYLEQVERVRGVLSEWRDLAREHGVRVCYHTHSGRFFGCNCAALAHMLAGFEPRWLGAYVDPGHMFIYGEDFGVGLAMIRDYLCAVAVKDVLLTRREGDGHGGVEVTWPPAGEGMIDWTAGFDALKAVGFDGPVSIHCQFATPGDYSLDVVKREVAFFRRFTA